MTACVGKVIFVPLTQHNCIKTACLYKAGVGLGDVLDALVVKNIHSPFKY